MYVALNIYEVDAILEVFVEIMMMFGVNFKLWHPQGRHSSSATALVSKNVLHYETEGVDNKSHGKDDLFELKYC